MREGEESRLSEQSEDSSSDPTGAFETPAPMRPFADRLIGRVRELGHPLCVGLDPHLAAIPPLFRQGSMAPGDPETAGAVEGFVSAVIDRLEGRVAIVKPQIAFFEQLGWRGIRALAHLCERARNAGPLVLLDAKRGDIGSTAEGYAKAYLAREAALPVDALTLNPYLGFDTLEPFTRVAREAGRGLFVLVKTSNSGSGDLQDREVEGEPLFGRVADGLVGIEAVLRAPETGWSSLGVVCGATWPDQARRVREALPHALFLVPGYGAQGGSAAAAVQGFVPGPKGLEGGIVNSSRAILFPEKAREATSAEVWEAAFDAAPRPLHRRARRSRPFLISFYVTRRVGWIAVHPAPSSLGPGAVRPAAESSASLPSSRVPAQRMQDRTCQVERPPMGASHPPQAAPCPAHGTSSRSGMRPRPLAVVLALAAGLALARAAMFGLELGAVAAALVSLDVTAGLLHRGSPRMLGSNGGGFCEGPGT